MLHWNMPSSKCTQWIPYPQEIFEEAIWYEKGSSCNFQTTSILKTIWQWNNEIFFSASLFPYLRCLWGMWGWYHRGDGSRGCPERLQRENWGKTSSQSDRRFFRLQVKGTSFRCCIPWQTMCFPNTGNCGRVKSARTSRFALPLEYTPSCQPTISWNVIRATKNRGPARMKPL